MLALQHSVDAVRNQAKPFGCRQQLRVVGQLREKRAGVGRAHQSLDAALQWRHAAAHRIARPRRVARLGLTPFSFAFKEPWVDTFIPAYICAKWH